MRRASKTAEPACRLLGLPCQIEDWTHEILDERLTTFPDSISKSVTDVQNTYFLENGITAPKCLCLSDISHLYAGGLGLTYNNTLEL